MQEGIEARPGEQAQANGGQRSSVIRGGRVERPADELRGEAQADRLAATIGKRFREAYDAVHDEPDELSFFARGQDLLPRLEAAVELHCGERVAHF